MSQLPFLFYQRLTDLEIAECNLIEMKLQLKRTPNDQYLRHWILVTEKLIDRMKRDE